MLAALSIAIFLQHNATNRFDVDLSDHFDSAACMLVQSFPHPMLSHRFILWPPRLEELMAFYTSQRASAWSSAISRPFVHAVALCIGFGCWTVNSQNVLFSQHPVISQNAVLARPSVSTQNAAAAQENRGRVLLDQITDLRAEARAGYGRISLGSDLLTLQVFQVNEESWAVQAQSSPFPMEVHQNEVLVATFEARCVAGPDSNGKGKINVFFAKNDPWTAISADDGFRTVTVPQQWHRFVIPVRSQFDFDAGQVYLGMQFAMQKQVVEIRSLDVRNLGDVRDAEVPYTPMQYSETDSSGWRQAAEQRIRQHRMRSITVQVVDAFGEPIANAHVSIQQLKHRYAFGTFVGDVPAQDSEDAQTFREKTVEWFNRVTVPRYWADGWGTASPRGLATANSVSEWAAQTDLEIKTHLLIYPQFIPESVKQLKSDPSAFQQAIEKAMDDALTTSARYPIRIWDGINELRDVDLIGEVLGQDYYADIFRRGKNRHPNATWFINEYGIVAGHATREQNIELYCDTIQSILDAGGPIEGIGVQCHYQDLMTNMDEVLETLDRLAEFALPIEVSEFDIDTKDEVAQAIYTRDFLTAVFSHPATSGITTWGFWEGDMWRPNGAMLRTDWSVKPNGKVWQDLVFGEWWTDEQFVTDSEGRIQCDVTRGDFEITASARGMRDVRRLEVDTDQSVRLQLGID